MHNLQNTYSSRCPSIPLCACVCVLVYAHACVCVHVPWDSDLKLKVFLVTFDVVYLVG